MRATIDWPERVWLVRHGQSAGNVARDAAEAAGSSLIDIATRDADVPLSELGQRQSNALGAWFAAQPPAEQPDVILTSPFVRSQQTAAEVRDALGVHDPVCVDERLREREFGILDRYTHAGVKASFPDLDAQRTRVGKFYFRPPGGESWCDVILRLRSVVQVLRRDYPERRVLIVAHQVVVNCFRYLIEHLDEQQVLAIDREADVPNCGVTTYRADRSEERACLVLVSANREQPLAQTGTPVTCAPDTPAGPK
ncbi:MAG TPA: histidine phosphatase family protein [Rudaea sp.]|jgi:broad specificity phosphatase PhoE